MLQALEMIGFKSFADKTRFEFPPGITVVVGPNGSGKSNVVDAVKWVLGEQSVKSLRGKEMADVIFNGSGTRRAMNYAETTLTFSNSDGRLPIDTPEVHVSRRVYRSGEGEYLINRQACRLRDIRDLFAGTGVSTQAYSIIEQGKVDVMLQSSPRDRRMIFEEAAGISRFKAKKLDALRRLERVDQNLLRLSDIVEEVANRLRTVRSQATKARRYREHTDRLQELRTQVGLTDWRHLSEQLAQFDAQLADLRDQSREHAAEIESVEARGGELERKLEQADGALRDCQRAAAEVGQRIAGGESKVENELARGGDLDAAMDRLRQQLVGLSTRTGDLSGLLAATKSQVVDADQEYTAVRGVVASRERELQELADRYQGVRDSHEAALTQQTEWLRQSGKLGNEITGLQSQIAAAAGRRRRQQEKLDTLAATMAELEQSAVETRQRHEQAEQQLARREADWAEAKQQLQRLVAERDALQEELAQLRQQQIGAGERAAMLEELEARQEGLGAGARELLLRSRQTPNEPVGQVVGLVADLLQVKVDAAPLIEIALGERAGFVVAAASEALQQWIVGGDHRLTGRVGIVLLDSTAAARRGVDLSGEPGVVARLDQYVEVDEEYQGLAAKLLSSWWVVEDLEHAQRLARGRSLNFVTLQGEAVTSDGTIALGPRQQTTGLISRRSQLRELRRQLAAYEQDVKLLAAKIADLRERVADSQQQSESLADSRDQAREQTAELQMQLRSAEDRLAQLTEQHQGAAAEVRVAGEEHDSAVTQLEVRQQELEQVEASLTDLNHEIQQADEQIEEINGRRQTCIQEVTAAKVELAKSEQQLADLTLRCRQYEQDFQERRRLLAEARQELEESRQRKAASQLAVLRTSSELAELYLAKEAHAAENQRLETDREGVRLERAGLSSTVQALRGRLRKLDGEIHKVELDSGQLQHQRQTLSDRLREDYGIELSELEHRPSAEEQSLRDEVEEEIAELRRKLNNIGGVNLEALDELEDLETRYEDLSAQFQDLSAAKVSLEQIIEKINNDSRRLFQETLETVREHFKGLFRKMFGGGQADIVLDDENDVLESGIEIVARPPGKEPRSISLLSGGEKTLTCVALLLAIFRSRPSPFCILDEVDAALDEANIGRFINVLREFLEFTQFIVITHSKKTMTCAGTLYGVTMQESGISKQVSVRFEDVTDTGEILESATRRETASDAA
ncbi:MAG: chromosome segregation protein SMC, partial [Pirellulales bacterium]